VLRDGAAAQYGSDAIAGVVNLRLRTDRKTGGEVTVSYGARKTEYGILPARFRRRHLDRADLAQAHRWPNRHHQRLERLALGDTGYLTIAAEYKDQEHTERSGYDVRQQYPKVANGAFDPRELTINRFNAWYGEPEMKQGPCSRTPATTCPAA
jgi:iron complex outermembrane receptor protein